MKRVRKLLAEIEKRATQSAASIGTRSSGTHDVETAAVGGKNGDKARAEEIVLKGTNKAIDRVLQLGLFFQGQGDVKVRIGTSSVGVVDDIEVEEGGDDQEEVAETRVRRVSVVEVGVRLR